MSNIQTEIPNQLWQQAQILVQQGWASNLQEVINEALRRYLESHQDVVAATDKWHPRALFCSQTAARNSLPQKMFGSADSH